jgi:eukaryotic-like serine/threonine-protein kinase
MLVAPALALAPLLALVMTAPRRAAAAAAAGGLLVWLHLWWLLPLFDIMQLPAEGMHGLLRLPQSPLVMTLGHLAVIALVLAAVGVFSPRPGSAADLAVRAASRGDLVAAGELWQEAGKPRRALRCFMRARSWGRAAEIARSLGRLQEAAELAEREGGGALLMAAQSWARLGQDGRAQMLWTRYGAYLVDKGQSEQAIEPFLRAGDMRRATHAVDLALQARRLTEAQGELALRAAREAKRPSLGAQVALALERYREAGDLFLAADEPLEAARAFTRAGDTMRAADALRRGGHNEDAARLRAQSLTSSGQWDLAVLEYEHAGMGAQAAATLAKLGRYDEAFRRYLLAGLRREAAEIARDHGNPREAGRLFEDLEEWGEAGVAWERAGEHLQAARCLERSGDFAHALELLERSGLKGEQAQLLARLGRLEEGFRVLYDAGDMRGAWELLSSYGGTYSALAEPLAKLAEWLEAQGEVTAAISAVQRATAGLSASHELMPALYTQAHLLERHGDLRAAQSVWQRIVDVDYGFRDAAARLRAAAAQRGTQEAAAVPAAAGESPSLTDPASRYMLEQELGRGGMGVVYRARDSRLGRIVAIKVLNPRQHTPEALRRFEREARAAAALSHPGIVHIYDFDRGFGSCFISMEFVPGPTVNQLVREEPAFVRNNLVPLMRQIAAAVGYAHSRHVIHRDLKPANMVLLDRRQVKILDFGIARRLDELELSASGATGTPYYMAPEQILGEEPDTRTDVYSLGVTFFQMATATLPFTTGNVLRSHLEQPAPDPRALAPELDAGLAALILRCLAKDPDQRPHDGSSLHGEIPAQSEDVLK